MNVSPPTGLPSSTGKIRESAEVFGIYANTWARLFMILVIAGIFVGLNYAVVKFIMTVFEADLMLMKESITTDRIVTTAVLNSLIAATVVQVGVAIIAIVSYLFPKGPQ